MRTDKAIFRHLEAELMRAEAVVQSDNGNKKQHQPTIDNHRGQIIALRKALAFLEMDETTPPGPVELNRNVNVTVSWRTFILIATIGAFLLI